MEEILGEQTETVGERKEDCPRGRKGREGKQSLSGLTHLILNLLNHLPSTCSVLSLWRVPLPQDEDSTLPHPQLPTIIPQRRQPLACTGVSCPSPTLGTCPHLGLHLGKLLCDPAESFGNTPLPPFLPQLHVFNSAVPLGDPQVLPHSSSRQLLTQQPRRFLETSWLSNPLTFPWSLLLGTSLEHRVVVILSLLVLPL